ncbi:LCCL domain-containing protein [Nostoc sp.]
MCLNGGQVRIRIRPGAASYYGTTRNGVNSRNYGSWGGSFIFVR